MSPLWHQFYKPSQLRGWSRRKDELQNERLGDSTAFFDMTTTHHSSFSSQKIGIIGFECDEGVSRNQGRTGAAQGPQILRPFLYNLPIHKPRDLIDCGNITCQNKNLEAAQAALSQAVQHMHQNNILPCVIGGGHETAWGHFQGIQATHSEKKIGIINFDAHFDIRALHQRQGHSGTPFLQIQELLQSKNKNFSYMCLGIQESSNTQSLFQKATQLNIQYTLAHEFENLCFHNLNQFIKSCDGIYLSICLDVFNAANAPGVSSPQPFGVQPSSFLKVLRHILEQSILFGVDIVELSPKHDTNNLTAKLASQIFYNIFHFMNS
ncbi:MAG: formimidoylglutamase [Oligoflexales bacterium]